MFALPTSHEDSDGEQTYTSTFSSTSAPYGGGWLTPRPGRFIPRKRDYCIAGWVGPRAGMDGCRNPRPPPPHRDSIPEPFPTSRFNIILVSPSATITAKWNYKNKAFNEVRPIPIQCAGPQVHVSCVRKYTWYVDGERTASGKSGTMDNRHHWQILRQQLQSTMPCEKAICQSKDAYNTHEILSLFQNQ